MRERGRLGFAMHNGTRLVLVMVGGAAATVLLFQVMNLLGY